MSAITLESSEFDFSADISVGASWPSFSAITVAVKEIWKEVEIAQTLPEAMLKAAFVVLSGIGRLALALTCGTIAGFVIFLNFPFTVKEWSRKVVVEHAIACAKETLVFTMSVLSTNISPKDHEIKKKGKIPILFIHGYFGSPATWLHHMDNLKDADIGSMYTIDLASNILSTDDFVVKVAQKVDAIRAKHLAETGEETQVILAGHSMGGNIGSRFATLDDQSRVKAVITIGAPLQGSERAVLGFGQSARDMERGAQILKEINQGISNRTDIQFFHLAGENDLFVRPIISAHPKAEGSHIRKIVIEGSGHSSLLYLESVSKVLVDCYKQVMVDQGA